MITEPNDDLVDRDCGDIHNDGIYECIPIMKLFSILALMSMMIDSHHNRRYSDDDVHDD
jgi:hypothetical protein